VTSQPQQNCECECLASGAFHFPITWSFLSPAEPLPPVAQTKAQQPAELGQFPPRPASKPRSKARWARTILEQAKPVPLRLKAAPPSGPAVPKLPNAPPRIAASSATPHDHSTPQHEHADDRWEMVIPKMARLTAGISPAVSRELPPGPPREAAPAGTEADPPAEPGSEKANLVRAMGTAAGAALLAAATFAVSR
jgi:hypothetical protein